MFRFRSLPDPAHPGARVRAGLIGLALGMLVACNLTPVDSHIPGYLTGPDGQLLFNEDGQCWRTANWQPFYAIPQCDPAIFRAQREQITESVPAPEEEAVAETPEPGDEEQPVASEAAESQEAIEPQEPKEPGETVSAADIDAMEAERIIERPLRFDGDASFHFGHYRLTREGGESVQSLARRLRMHGAEDLAVTVVGHTDRIGNAAANQTLSERRATAVRDALIEHGIDYEVITIEGRGETEPVTTLEDCPDDLHECELIHCLRPDRRVEIEVQAVRRIRR